MTTQTKTNPQLQITHIPLADIHPSPMNPRKHFDDEAIKELAQSISVDGVLSPILVRFKEISEDGELGFYEIIAGERRYRASCTVPGMETIPCIIRDMTDEQVLEVMIVENLQRKDINPMEEAAGFLQLSNVKHMDAKEIAAMVGKSTGYVAQRMKLNDLIEPIQQFFFNGHLLIKDAFTISKLSPTDQRELYEQELMGESDVYALGKWTMQKYTHKLKNAPFDIDDAQLIPSAGACPTCPYNSASNFLFADQESDPVCQNTKCFSQKCDLSFAHRYAEASQDPTIVMITGQYNPDKSTQALIKKSTAVVTYHDYTIIPEPEVPDRKDFDNDNETREEDDADYISAVDSFKADISQFHHKCSTGAYQKAFVLGGDDKGAYVYIKRSTKTASAKKSTPVTGQPSKKEDEIDIKNEITSIQNREKRAQELDDAKIWDAVYIHLDPLKVTKEIGTGPLTQVERNAAAYAIYDKLAYSNREKFKKLFLCKSVMGQVQIPDVEIDDLQQMLRFFIMDVLPIPQITGTIKGNQAIIKKVAESYWPEVIGTIEDRQQEVAATRATRVEKRIKALQDKLKEIKKPATKSVKIASKTVVKKGKGIKVLIPDHQDS